jgi:iron-sulfur cluster assembly protein
MNNVDEIFTITEKASTHLKKLMSEDPKVSPEHFLRVGVKGGGCSGLSYDLGFDNVEQEGDKYFTSSDIRIAIDKKSFLYLFGTELDFTDGLNGKGFHFNNPNASRTCGCGESFAI